MHRQVATRPLTAPAYPDHKGQSRLALLDMGEARGPDADTSSSNQGSDHMRARSVTASLVRLLAPCTAPEPAGLTALLSTEYQTAAPRTSPPAYVLRTRKAACLVSRVLGTVYNSRHRGSPHLSAHRRD